MTIAKKIRDSQSFVGTVAINSTGTFAITIPADGTMVVVATILLSHFAGGHQNAGGSLFTSATFEGQNGVYSLVPALMGVSSPISTNPAYGYATIPSTADTDFGGPLQSTSPTAVWSVSGSTALMTLTNTSTATASFDYWAWVDIWTAASS